MKSKLFKKKFKLKMIKKQKEEEKYVKVLYDIEGNV